MKGNYPLDKALLALKNNRLVNPLHYRDIKENAEIAIQDGLFDHHICFAYRKGEHVYYTGFFSKGWQKRRPNSKGWIKYLNALAYNIIEGRYDTRRSIFGKGK